MRILWVLLFALLSLQVYARTLNGCTCTAPCRPEGETYNWCKVADTCGSWTVFSGYWDKCNSQCESGCPSGSSCQSTEVTFPSFRNPDTYNPAQLACVCADSTDCVPSSYCFSRVVAYEGATCHATGSTTCCSGKMFREDTHETFFTHTLMQGTKTLPSSAFRV
jgi:hypothetical protein